MSEGSHKFNLIEATVIVCIFLLLGGVVVIVLPGLVGRGTRTPSLAMQSNTQARGIHQSLVMYAQGNGGHYPGFDSSGNLVDASVEYRYQQLLDGMYFTGEYMISPVDSRVEWLGGPVSSSNYSYAMLDVNAKGERAQEWRETLNQFAPVLSDRNSGPEFGGTIASVHTNTLGDWQGSVAWNDNHVRFEVTHLVDTIYGAGASNIGDNLFEEAGGDDAYMIFSGD